MLLCKSQNIESNGGDHSASGGSQNSLSSTAAKTQRYLFKTSLKVSLPCVKINFCPFSVLHLIKSLIFVTGKNVKISCK